MRQRQRRTNKRNRQAAKETKAKEGIAMNQTNGTKETTAEPAA
jgi:hypothetical protein